MLSCPRAVCQNHTNHCSVTCRGSVPTVPESPAEEPTEARESERSTPDALQSAPLQDALLATRGAARISMLPRHGAPTAFGCVAYCLSFKTGPGQAYAKSAVQALC